MFDNIFEREIILIGEKNLEKIRRSHIAVFGVGGVGSFVVEALVRAGVGELTLVDFDRIEESNLNRQLHTTTENIHLSKVDEMMKRAVTINPHIKINAIHDEYNFMSHEFIFNEKWDYIVDAIDMVQAKILLIEKAKDNNIPIISSMGTGNKMNPSLFRIDDINKTKMCPLARIMRKELRKRRINNVKVLFSTEKPDNFTHNHRLKGTISFVPSTAGLLIASEVIRDILKGLSNEK